MLARSIFFITILILAQGIFFSCKKVEDENRVKISDIRLDTYQKDILNGFYSNEGINIYADLEFIRYRLPKIKTGKIVVHNNTPQSKEELTTLIMRDSFLIQFGRGGSNLVEYDSNQNVTRYMAMNLTYENGRLIKADNGASDWSYHYEDDCIINHVTDRSNAYKAEKKYCYDDKNRLISLEVTRNLDFTDESYRFQYDKNMLVGKQYFEMKDKDTIAFTITTVDSLENGLIKSYTEKVKASTLEVTTQYQNEFDFSNTNPLIIKKRIYKNSQPKYEIIYTFNERNHLSAYHTVGEYGDKYTVTYEYEE